MAHTVAAVSQDPTPAAADAPLFGIASIGRHAVLYAIGNILSRAVAFVMLPIYTRYLSPADYGVAALIEMTLDVIGMIAGAQIAHAIFRFYHKTDSNADKRAVVSTALTTLVVSFGLLGLAIFMAAPRLSTLVFGSDVHAGLIRLGAGSFALQSLLLVPLAFARIQERSGLVVSASLLKLVISVGFNLVFVVGLGLGVRGVFISTLFSNLVVGIWLGIWTMRHVGIGIRPDLLRSLVRFGVPLIGVQMATYAMTFSDRYFLQAAGNAAIVGLYNLAYQFGFLLLMLGFVPIEMIWGPRRFQVARKPNPSPILAKAFRLINVSVITIGVGIGLFVGDLLRIMSSPPFHPAADIVPIILIAYVFHGWAMLHDIGVLVKERTELLTVANWIAALVALAGFSILIPRFLAFGAAAAAVMAFGVRWGLTYRFSQRLWRVQYDWWPVIRLAAVGVSVCVASLLLPPMGVVTSIAVHLLLFALYLILVWSFPILTPDEKRKGFEQIRRVAGAIFTRGRDRSAASPTVPS
jgi:O-antigen/teichoic acid export membrane protein